MRSITFAQACRLIVFSAAAIAMFAGCQSRMTGPCVIDTYRQPLVSLKDTTATENSPARACVVLPHPAPVFPRNMYMAQIEGTVVVRVTIGKNGVVKDVVAVESSQREFEEASVAAVTHWKFFEMRNPGVKDSLGAIVDCTIEFALNAEETTPWAVMPVRIVAR